MYMRFACICMKDRKREKERDVVTVVVADRIAACADDILSSPIVGMRETCASE